MPNHKKVSPKGAYDKQFSRTTSKTGKWRGHLANLYKRYKRAKRSLQTSVIDINGVRNIPNNIKAYVKDWGKLNYQSKDKE